MDFRGTSDPRYLKLKHHGGGRGEERSLNENSDDTETVKEDPAGGCFGTVSTNKGTSDWGEGKETGNVEE